LKTILKQFLLTEAQPKNALINPSPNFGKECKNLREHRHIRVGGTGTTLPILQFYNFQASLNHRANACSCFSIAYFTKILKIIGI
jgi:hypothetical protein